MEAPVTTEFELDDEWLEDFPVEKTPTPHSNEEREIGRRHARALLDIFYDVHRECVHINLGLVPDPDELGT